MENAKPSPVFTFHLNHTGMWFEDEAEMYSQGLGMTADKKRLTTHLGLYIAENRTEECKVSGYMTYYLTGLQHDSN